MRYLPFVRGIHRWPLDSPHKGQWHGALFFIFDVRLNKRLSKQSEHWWFEAPSRSLWCHCKVVVLIDDSILILYISYHLCLMFLYINPQMSLLMLHDAECGFIIMTSSPTDKRWRHNHRVIISENQSNSSKSRQLHYEVICSFGPEGKNSQHFADYIFNCNVINGDYCFSMNCSKVCFQRSNLDMINSGNGSVPSRRQAITWTNDVADHWCLIES